VCEKGGGGGGGGLASVFFRSMGFFRRLYVCPCKQGRGERGERDMALAHACTDRGVGLEDGVEEAQRVELQPLLCV
jgi:hypothetical protein